MQHHTSKTATNFFIFFKLRQENVCERHRKILQPEIQTKYIQRLPRSRELYIVLLNLIKQFIQRTHLDEIALMRERKNVLAAGANHKSIMSALRRRNLEAACAALCTNLQTGREPIVAWLRARESEGGS